MKALYVLLGIIAAAIIIIAVLTAIIVLLIKEIKRWRLRVAFLESEIRRSDKEMVQ